MILQVQAIPNAYYPKPDARYAHSRQNPISEAYVSSQPPPSPLRRSLAVVGEGALWPCVAQGGHEVLVREVEWVSDRVRGVRGVRGEEWQF